MSDALGRAISGDRPAIAKVAKSLGMSARTVQRRLRELGTTDQDLLDDVRRRSARRLLTSTDLGIGEVAFLLGFEEVNSVQRAFHVWEGITPAKWRAKDDTGHDGGQAAGPRWPNDVPKDSARASTSGRAGGGGNAAPLKGDLSHAGSERREATGPVQRS